MKKYFATLLFLLVSLTGFSQQWSLSYDLPPNSIPFMLECVDDLVLVPTTGGIYRSDNKGATWNKISDTVVFDISCYDKNTCYACGTGGMVYKTNNGGINWVTTSSKPHPTKKFVDIKAVSPTKILVDAVSKPIGGDQSVYDTLYSYDSLYITSDGGNSWIKTDVPILGDYPDVSKTRYIFNDSLVFTRVKGTVEIWGTNDLGATMFKTNKEYNPQVNYLQFDMLSAQTGFLLQLNRGNGNDPSGTILKTTDGGRKFDFLFTTSQNLENTIKSASRVNCFDFVDENTGWLSVKMTLTPDIYKTTNGGTQWVRDTLGFSSTGANDEYTKLYMQTANYGWGIDKPHKKIVKYGAASTIGIEPIANSNVAIYPNPSATGIYNIQGLQNDNTSVLITDLTGREVVVVIGNQIDLSEQETGIYIAIITTNGKSYYQKLVRQ